MFWRQDYRQVYSIPYISIRQGDFFVETPISHSFTKNNVTFPAVYGMLWVQEGPPFSCTHERSCLS